MHVHSAGGQPRVWTGVVGNNARRQLAAGSFKFGDTTSAGTVAKGQFADVLNTTISASGIKESTFDETVRAQMYSSDTGSVFGQYTSAGLQKMPNSSLGYLEGTDTTPKAAITTPTSTTPDRTTSSTKGNLVDVFA